MMRWLVPIAAAMIAGLVAFWIVIQAVPGFIMGRALDRLAAMDAGWNQVWHGPPTDETSRRVVRPSPDILYSVCPYDLSDGPLRLTVPWPDDGSYASVSFYDADTNNFAVISDRDRDPAGRNAILLVGGSRIASLPSYRLEDDEQIVLSFSSRGLALYRRVVMGGTTVEQADQEREAFSCQSAPGRLTPASQLGNLRER